MLGSLLSEVAVTFDGVADDRFAPLTSEEAFGNVFANGVFQQVETDTESGAGVRSRTTVGTTVCIAVLEDT
jgi:hypothetical protein